MPRLPDSIQYQSRPMDAAEPHLLWTKNLEMDRYDLMFVYASGESVTGEPLAWVRIKAYLEGGAYVLRAVEKMVADYEGELSLAFFGGA